jgi:hypothetical protein
VTNEPSTSTDTTELNIPDIEFPENPTTTHLEKTVNWLLEHSDPYVVFMNNGPFVIGTSVRFIISNEGDAIDTPAAALNLPMYVLHDDMPEALVNAFEEVYGVDGEVEEDTIH